MHAQRRRFLLAGGACVAAAHPALGALSRQPAGTAGGAPPALLLASMYTDAIDPATCLVSEKFDGVRAVWDGQVLRHRSGRPVPAPGWFTARLPGEPLDGELWLGRQRFEALVGAVRRTRPDDAEWRSIRYLVFDLPGAPGSFAARVVRLARLAATAGSAAFEAVAQGRVADRAALRERLRATVALGGEGLMLHRADALSTTGRSDVLTKLKPQHDAEAVVVGVRPGTGKYAGQVGALQVETPEGLRFHLGSGLPDRLRLLPPARGSVVTYRYHDRTSAGVPRFASFLRIHAEL